MPVKAFSQAKQRLAPVLEPSERARLAREMATRVVAAAGPLPVAVVCDDPSVAAWAHAIGARVLSEPGLGLNGAVAAAYRALGEEGYEHLVIAHSDLPLATDLGWLTELEGVTLVPDRRGEGTNVISLPTLSTFQFRYGAGSLARHEAQARLTGLPWRIVRDDALAWDVDVPADMEAVAK